MAYSGTPPPTRNDHYGYGRLNARLALNAATADTTAPTFKSSHDDPLSGSGCKI